MVIYMNQQSAAELAWFLKRLSPACPVAIRVIRATIKHSTFPGEFLNDFASILRTFDANLIQDLLCVTALRERAAAYKAAITTLAEDQGISAQGTIATYRFRFSTHIYFTNGLICNFKTFRELGIELIDNGHPRLSVSNLI
jgi:hypothetical protein